jgi:hypothetical protein
MPPQVRLVPSEAPPIITLMIARTRSLSSPNASSVET